MDDKHDLFAAAAPLYAQFRPTYSPAMLADIDQLLLELHTPRSIYLDIACGTGQLLLPLGESFARPIGVDISEKQLAQALLKAKDPKYSVH